MKGIWWLGGAVIALCLIVVVGAFLTMGPSLSGAREASSDSLPAGGGGNWGRQYLLFQVFTGGPDPNTGKFESGRTKAEFQKIAQRIVREVRPESNHPDRILGFSVGPIALDQSEAEVTQLIADVFDIARQTDVAVALHLDDYMFWSQAKDLDGNLIIHSPANREWRDWQGTPSGNNRIEWLESDSLPPQLCYESPAVAALVERRAKSVIGAEVRRQMDLLQQAGKEHLFAGIMVGWESNLADGYCSLSHMGYSEQDPPEDLDRARETVLGRHIERWAKGLHDAGIPKEKLFTHVAFIPERGYEGMKRKFSREEIRNMRQSAAFRAFWIAFNDYSNPGFTIYPMGELFDEIYRELQGRAGPGWAMAEGTNYLPSILPSGTTPGTGGSSDMDWETYLARSFSHGARMVNIFGGFQGDFGPYSQATESPEAITAYRKFLRGETLTYNRRDAGASQSPSAAMSGGMPLNQRIEKYLRNGGDLTKIQAKLETLDRLTRAGQTDEASALVREIERLLE